MCILLCKRGQTTSIKCLQESGKGWRGHRAAAESNLANTCVRASLLGAAQWRAGSRGSGGLPGWKPPEQQPLTGCTSSAFQESLRFPGDDARSLWSPALRAAGPGLPAEGPQGRTGTERPGEQGTFILRSGERERVTPSAPRPHFTSVFRVRKCFADPAVCIT